jgi:hypothetical protein
VAILAAALNQMLDTVQERDTALATRVRQEAAVVQLGMDAFAVRTLGELLQRARPALAAAARSIKFSRERPFFSREASISERH